MTVYTVYTAYTACIGLCLSDDIKNQCVSISNTLTEEVQL